MGNDNAGRIPVECEVGSRFRVVYGPGNPNNRLWHVRGFVDGQAVCRTWELHRARWRYDMWPAIRFRACRSFIRWGRSKADEAPAA